MKSKVYFLFISLIITISSIGQTEWEWLNPKPTGHEAIDIEFVAADTGYIVTKRTILQTVNCGSEWTKIGEVYGAADMEFNNSSGLIVGSSGSILRTTDNGLTWNEHYSGIRENLNSISYVTKDTIFLSSPRKLLSSNDAGISWEITEVNGYILNDIYFRSSNLGFAACNNGIIAKTTDGGNSWFSVYSHSANSVSYTEIIFVNELIGFANREYGGAILKTVDGGETWFELNNYGGDTKSFFFIDSLTGFLAGDDGYLEKTTDGGLTWTNSGFGSRNSKYGLTSIYFLNHEIGFAVGERGRIMKTVNGGSEWEPYSVTYTDIKNIQFTSNDIGYCISTFNNVLLKTIDGGKNWQIIENPLSDYTISNFEFIDDLTGYVIGETRYDQHLFKTVDGGHSWSLIYNDLSNSQGYLNSIEFLNEEVGYVSGGTNTGIIKKTENGGLTWTVLSYTPLHMIQFIDESVGFGLHYGGLYKTIDGGLNWEPIFDVSMEDVRSFHFLSRNEGIIAGEQGLTFKTIDGGTTWKELETEYEDYKAVRFFTPNIVFLSSESNYTIHIYKSINGGYSWEELSQPGISTPNGLSHICYTENHLYVAGAEGIILKDSIIRDSITILTLPVIEYSATDAILSTLISSNVGDITNIEFKYGPSYSFDTSIILDSVEVKEGFSDSLSVYVSGLQPNTHYTFKISYNYKNRTYTSDYQSFTTLEAQNISIDYVYNYTSNTANLSGNVTSYVGLISNIEFQYGTDSLFENSVSAQPNQVIPPTTQSVSAILSNLIPETTYFVRLKTYSNDSNYYSNIISFQTYPDYTIEFLSPNFTESSVSIQAHIVPYKDTMRQILLEYGPDGSFTNSILMTPNQIDQKSNSTVTAEVNDIDLNTVYLYRIKAILGNDTVISKQNILQKEETLTILPSLILPISNNSILIHGLINSYGMYLNDIVFEYGTTYNFESSVPASPNYIYNHKTNTISAKLENLLIGRKYYFRIKASSGSELFYSDIFSYIMGEGKFVAITSDEPEITIYPNPTLGKLSIFSNEAIQKIELLNSVGKIIYSGIDYNNDFLSKFDPGLYFLKIYTDHKATTTPIIKM